MKYPLDIWSILAITIVVAVLIFVIKLIRSRLEHQKYLEEMAELAFEQSVLGAAGVVKPPPDTDQTIPIAGTEASAAPLFSEQNSPVIVDSTTDTSLPADVRARSVINQLEASGLLRNIDGHLELHGNPKGVAILRLKTGRTALLVPHFESEAFLQRNAKRADMIIVTGTEGKAYVIRPMAEFIAENIAGL